MFIESIRRRRERGGGWKEGGRGGREGGGIKEKRGATEQNPSVADQLRESGKGESRKAEGKRVCVCVWEW